MTYLLIICIALVFYFAGYSHGYNAGRDDMIVPTACIHGHIDWDDCPDCGH